MTAASRRARGRRGPARRWGDRDPCTINWPAEHREVYDRAASEAGLSLNEYVIRQMASAHGLPSQPGADSSTGDDPSETPKEDPAAAPQQLKLGA